MGTGTTHTCYHICTVHPSTVQAEYVRSGYGSKRTILPDRYPQYPYHHSNRVLVLLCPSKRRIREELKVFSRQIPHSLWVPYHPCNGNKKFVPYSSKKVWKIMREAGQTGTTRLEGGGFTLVHNETSQLRHSIARHSYPHKPIRRLDEHCCL